MGKFYGRLPHELLTIDCDQFTLDFRVWYEWIQEQEKRRIERELKWKLEQGG
jgi:hypothetical protein